MLDKVLNIPHKAELESLLAARQSLGSNTRVKSC